MNYAAVSLLILKMYEPVFAIFGMYPTALVRTVNLGFALCQYYLVLVGTERRFAAHGQLEACGHAACRAHNPVPALALVELGALASAVLSTVAIEYDDGLSDGLGAFGIQLANGEYRGELRT